MSSPLVGEGDTDDKTPPPLNRRSRAGLLSCESARSKKTRRHRAKRAGHSLSALVEGPDRAEMSSVPLRSKLEAAGVPGSWSHWQRWNYYACTAPTAGPGALRCLRGWNIRLRRMEHPPTEDGISASGGQCSQPGRSQPGHPARIGPWRVEHLRVVGLLRPRASGRPNPRWTVTGAPDTLCAE